MHKLAAVEEARALMSEGQNWGVWKWLMEKSRVRQAADSATEALAKAAKDAKRAWGDDLHKAYRELVVEAELEEGKPGAMQCGPALRFRGSVGGRSRRCTRR